MLVRVGAGVGVASSWAVPCVGGVLGVTVSRRHGRGRKYGGKSVGSVAGRWEVEERGDRRGKWKR